MTEIANCLPRITRIRTSAKSGGVPAVVRGVGANVLEELAAKTAGIFVAERAGDGFGVGLGGAEEAFGSLYFQGCEKLMGCLAEGNLK